MNAIPMNIEPTNEVNPFGWVQRTMPRRFDDGFDALNEFLKNRSRVAQTKIMENREIELVAHPEPRSRDDLNQMLMVIDNKPMGMTHWSFGQLAQLAKAPPAYLRTLPAAMVVDALHYGLKHIREVEQIKPYYDGSELRAVTGPGYGRVDDWEVVDALQSVLDTGRWQPARDHMGFSVTDRSMQLFLIDEHSTVEVGRDRNGNSDTMQRGLRIYNSELGYSSLGVEGFWFRSYCTNGCIFGMDGAHTVSIRHSKGAPYRWAREVQPAIEAYASQDGTKFIEQVEHVKAARVAADDDAAVEFMNRRGLSRAQARLAIERIGDEEGLKARSAWSIVQGITSVARDVKTAEERADLEKIAGSIWMKAAR